MERTALTSDLALTVLAGDITSLEGIEQFNNMTAVEAVIGKAYRSKSEEERKAQYLNAKQLRENILNNSIGFLKNFPDDLMLSQGLVFIGAKTGNSKSTTAANILANFIQTTDKRAIVITNEEEPDAVYDRIACVLLEKNYIDLHKRKMKERDKEHIAQLSQELTKRIEVVNDGDWNMTYLEDVQAVLEYAAKTQVGLVILDYFQTVTNTRKDDEASSYHVFKKLGHYLKDYGRRVGVPVVVFAQLDPLSKDVNDITKRVQGDKTICAHAFIVIEIIPDFETLITTFKIHKERFGLTQGREIVMKFNQGRYEPLGGL